MSITVSPVLGGPPMVEVTVTGGGGTMTAATLTRTAAGATVNAPWQPPTGGTSATVQDIEIPWDVPVTYTATVTTSGGTSTYTAAPVTVSASAAWAIHPVYPQRSLIIDQQYPTTGTWITAVDVATRPAQYTEHLIVGTDFPITVTSGPRASIRGSMTVHTSDAGDRAALRALVQDQTPILIRFPDTWGVDWENGFYQLGDVAETRLGAAATGDRLFTIPFLRVQPPAVTTRTGWDYPTITSTFADYAALTAAFADYPSLTANRRS